MADHLQQTAAGVMVLFVDLQVLGQVSDALGQYRNLDFGGTGVLLVDAVGLDDGSFLFFLHHIGYITSLKIWDGCCWLWDQSPFPCRLISVQGR